jgi:glycosyltransferase involved in cell wall biosynthesis
MLPIKILRALKKHGIDVVVAYLSARPPWELRIHKSDFEGTTIYKVPPIHWASGEGLSRIAREQPFDLVHAQHYGGATRAYAACRRHRWPMVYEIHSLLGDEVERDRLGRGLVFRAYMELEKRVLRRAAAIITLGEPVKEVIVNERGVPGDRVSVIYPGIDLAEYERPSAPIEIPGIGPDHKVIMYVGSIVHPNQGVPILIDALPKVFDALPQARCVLVGGPAEAGEAYRAQLNSHGDRLVVLTGQTPEQVVALSRRADVLVHSRLACRENFSVQSKLAVYLAAGRPIVATDFGDYRHLLGDTGAGILTPVAPEPIADAILNVLTDQPLADRLAAATLPVAKEHFAMDRNIDRYLDVYHRAISAGPR